MLSCEFPGRNVTTMFPLRWHEKALLPWWVLQHELLLAVIQSDPEGFSYEGARIADVWRWLWRRACSMEVR